jgi:diadenosine tetraphosphate (Ap4A) HIT family hydrolase
VHLVVDVLDHAYIAMDKGPISDTHALVIAVEHFPNQVTLKPEAIADINKIQKALHAAYASRGLSLVGFERCVVLRR